MKKVLLNICLFLFLFQVVVYAQPSIRQQRTIGTTYYDNASCMALSKDGGYLLGGGNNGTGDRDQTEHGHGDLDIWIVKLDSLRNIQWDKTIGGSGTERLYSIESTSDGGYILGAESNSDISGDKTQMHIGSYDNWIIKIDSVGNIQWDKTIGGTSTEIIGNIRQTSDGGYILSCQSDSDSSGQKTEHTRGYNDFWVVKLDASGNIQWDKTLGGDNFDTHPKIALAADGGYLVAGESTSDSSGEKTNGRRGRSYQSDYWIINLDSTGKVQWDETIGGGGNDLLTSVNSTFDKGFILGGYSYSNKSFQKSEDSKGVQDFWVVKIDSLGRIKWDRTIGGTSVDDFPAVHQTREGGYILAGSSSSGKGADKSEPNRGDYDYWVVKLNQQGGIMWDKTIGGKDYDELQDIQEIGPHRYAMLGWSESGNTKDKNKPSKGFADYWYVELKDFQTSGSLTNVQATSTVSSDIKTKITFKVYPNPAKEVLYITASSTTFISLINQRGQVLLTKEINGKAVIDISKYPAGIYYLKDNKTSSVEKVIVTR